MRNAPDLLILVLLLSLVATSAHAGSPPPLPSGPPTQGGASGALLVVDTLEDIVADDGFTSLREAVLTPGARTIEVRVEGVLELRTPLWVGGDPAEREFAWGDNPYGHVTLLGPTHGRLEVTGAPLMIGNQVTDVLIRYLRFRGTDRDGDGNGASAAEQVRIGNARRVAGSFRSAGP